MVPKFQISLEYIVLITFLIIGGVAMYFVGSAVLPVSDVNDSTQSVLEQIKGEGDASFAYNVTQEFGTDLTIFGMTVNPYTTEEIFSQTALNYSVTFLATGEVEIAGPLLPGSSVTPYFGDYDEWFSIQHISYSDGYVNYIFDSSIMEDYLS